jgi:hypothetical protein
MFQYSAARAVALRHGVSLKLDLSWFGTDPDRKYALSPFSIDAETFIANRQPPKSLVARISRRIRRGSVSRKGRATYYAEKSFRYDPAIETLHSPVELDGYFQSERYFDAYRDQIIQDFTLREGPEPVTCELLDRISSSEAIALHIRRGDYVTNAATNAYHGTCDMDYYRSGLDIVRQGMSRPHCFVFSDDPRWARENLQTDIPTTFVDVHASDRAHEDLRLMRACKRFVIANSSFSWWGAWLGQSADKVVVAPRRWFKDEKMDTSDLIPDDWIQV